MRMGAEVVPALQKTAAETTDPEVRQLAETALAQIEQDRLTGPSIITIKADRITPAELFARVSEQCGVKLETMPPNLFDSMRDNRLSIDIDHQPFWPAMKTMTEKTGLSLTGWNNDMKLTSGQNVQGPTVVSGPYQITATNIQRSRMVDLGSGASGNTFVVQLMIMAEPKLKMTRASGGAKLETAVDENGASLVPAGGDGRVDYGYYSSMGNMWHVQAALADVPNIGKRIATLRGSVEAVLCTRSERIEIAQVLDAKNVDKAIGDASITLVEVARRGNDGFELRLRARLNSASAVNANGGGGGGDLDWTRFPMQAIRLLDANGRQLQSRGSSASVTNNVYETTLQYAMLGLDGSPTGEPVTLVWDVPVETKPITIPFEFKDLPVP